MSDRPIGADVAVYRVGFGDCFLLTVRYARSARHVLIDFGTSRRAKGGATTLQVAKDIATRCGGKLHGLVVTHRHRDHLSAFGGAAGKLIAKLNPEVVSQPWTEDPAAQPKARGPAMEMHPYVGGLQSLQELSALAARRVDASGLRIEDERARQARALFNVNAANQAALRALRAMPGKHEYLFYGYPSSLDDVLPGVRVHVLGPPTLAQWESIAKQRSKDAGEFWHLMSGMGASARSKPLFPDHESVSAEDAPAAARWFLRRVDRAWSDEMYGLVRILDDALNNTSLILLFEIAGRRLLFAGDAQLEAWQYALRDPRARDLLRDVDLYKVGHHGSLNATPKTLWSLFGKRGNGLVSVLSTLNGVHGSKKSGTEVPRTKLVEALKRDTRLIDTRESRQICESVSVGVP